MIKEEKGSFFISGDEGSSQEFKVKMSCCSERKTVDWGGFEKEETENSDSVQH